MGYWAPELQDVVLTNATGPGPQARHDKNSYYPDPVFHEAEVTRIYHESGRLHTYLGDWHTHPNSRLPRLSWRDRRTLRRIATDSQARAPLALMAVIAGRVSWSLGVWRHRPLFAHMPRIALGVKQLAVRVY